MKESVVARDPNEFNLSLLWLKLSARGAVALILTIPISIVLIAAAWRLAMRWRPRLTSSFPLWSLPRMEDLAFKIRRVVGTHDEVIARVENFLICRAAYEKALFVYPTDRLEMRQGARVVMRSKEDGWSLGLFERVDWQFFWWWMVVLVLRSVCRGKCPFDLVPAEMGREKSRG
jgi:hypothetical protein